MALARSVIGPRIARGELSPKVLRIPTMPPTYSEMIAPTIPR
jgi:hypothetical protein